MPSRDEHERSQRERNLLEFLEEIGQRFRGCQLGNYEVKTDSQRKAVSRLRQYAETMNTQVRAGRGIVLFGPCGTGKTHLLAAIGAAAILRWGYEARAVTGADLFGELRASFDNDQKREDTVIRRYATPRILVLNDPCPPGSELTDYKTEALFRLIDRRYRAGLPTFCAMNATSGSDAANQISEATVRRLRDGALAIHCNWPSYRKSSSK